ncbi:Calcium-gated potassium channel MthK [uncultured archaeon]|nr:Calcium-gated potassium channel MthK [uncultured archaeon]
MYYFRLERGIPDNLKISVALLFLIIVIGTSGFHLIENVDLISSLYWTVATVTTIGYGDIVPHTTGGRIFSIIIMISGVSVAIYTFTAAMAFSMEGELKTILGMSKMQEKIDRLKGHVIVCGYGKVGKNIVSNLIKEEIPFVVIEKETAAIDILARNNILHIVGDATYQETLEMAGISRGKVLISCLSNDADNLYVIIEAKEMNPDIRLILRASRPESVKRFMKLGADKVILPEEAGANQMASAAKEYL